MTPCLAQPASGSSPRSGADALTVLRTDPDKRATKLVRRCATGVVVDGFGAGKWFSVETVPVSDLASLAAGLDRVAGDPRAFVIRGEPLPDADLTRCQRLLHPQADGTPPTFADVPRRWVLLDFDAVEWPPKGREFAWGWEDGELSASYLRELLPPEFRRASFWWSYTGSAGFKPGLRMRLAFWLDRPTTGDELRRWLADVPVDHAIFGAVQPIYVAEPILRGVPDPVPLRSGTEAAWAPAVAVPELAPPAPAPVPPVPPVPQRPARRDGWPFEVLADVARAIATTPPAAPNRWGHAGRHNALFCGALRLSGLIGKGFLDANATVRTLAAAARHAGIDDREGARTIRNAFREGGLLR